MPYYIHTFQLFLSKHEYGLLFWLIEIDMSRILNARSYKKEGTMPIYLINIFNRHSLNNHKILSQYTLDFLWELSMYT